MKRFLKQHAKKIGILSADLLSIPLAVYFRYLSERMLQTESTCVWVRLGGQCITCGGTHFCNDLLSGRIAAAFADNQFLFLLAVYFLVSWLALNLYWLFHLGFAKRILRWMYNIPTLIIGCVAMFAFLILRNTAMIGNILQLWFAS
jgi:hypothetical protein